MVKLYEYYISSQYRILRSILVRFAKIFLLFQFGSKISPTKTNFESDIALGFEIYGLLLKYKLQKSA